MMTRQPLSRRALSRRTMLRGMGAALALPFLDAMVPAFAGSASKLTTGKPPVRMAIAYVPNGIIMEDWTPAEVGSNFSLPKVLEPVADFRDDILMFSGLTHNNGRALGDGPGDHARAAASFLTGVHPRKTDGADIQNGVSVDQVAAQMLGDRTRFASIELGTEHGRLAGNCDSGYSCAYSNSVSWRNETVPMPPEVNPRLVFERLFGRAGTKDDPAARAKRRRYDKSILDFVQEDTRKLKGDLGPTDRRKLDEYLDAVREIEKRISVAETSSSDAEPTIDRPAGIPVSFADHTKLMFDLQVVAFQTDLTRITSFMLGREGSNRTYREIGVPYAHHGLTHHQNDEEKIRQISSINRFHMEQFAYFLQRLDSIKEGDGTLLDHSMVLYGSGLADGNKHTHHDLPVLVAGHGGGALHPGRHARYPEETPMTNLYLSMLDIMGVQPESVGDSNGKLEHLSDI